MDKIYKAWKDTGREPSHSLSGFEAWSAFWGNTYNSL